MSGILDATSLAGMSGLKTKDQIDLNQACTAVQDTLNSTIHSKLGHNFASGQIGPRGVSALMSGISVTCTGWIGNVATITAVVETGSRMSILEDYPRKVEDLTILLDGGAEYNPNHPPGTVLPRGQANFMQEAADRFLSFYGAEFSVKSVDVF